MWQAVETCAICLEPYWLNDRVSYSRHRNCAHAFHAACILAWLRDEFRNDCPMCRGPYLHLCVVEDDVVEDLDVVVVDAGKVID